jgi:hypothetical protein
MKRHPDRIDGSLLLCLLLSAMLGACGDGGEEYVPEEKPTLSKPEPLPTGGPVPPQTSLVCPTGTQLTWNNFAKGFVYDYCTSCHSSHVVDDQRAGAPETSNFDSAADVIVARGIILDKAVGAAATMPPAGNVPAVEQELFAEWLNCGAPID